MITNTIKLGLHFKSTTIFFMLGICSYQIIFTLSSYSLCLLGSTVLIAWVSGKYILKIYVHPLLGKKLCCLIYFSITSMICGYIHMFVNVQLFKYGNKIYSSVENQQINVVAKILNITPTSNNYSFTKQPLNYGIKLDLLVEEVNLNHSNTIALYQLRKFIINAKIRAVWFHPPSNILPGERWQLLLRVTKPRNFKTLGSFDLEKQFFSQRIKLIGKVIPSTDNCLLRHSNFTWWIAKTRSQIQQNIKIKCDALPLKKNLYF